MAWLSYFTLGAVALLTALLVVFTLAVALHGERRWGHRYAASLAPLLLLGIAIGSLMSNRVLTHAFENIDSVASFGRPGGSNVQRLLTLAVMALSAAIVLGAMFRRRRAAGQPALAAPGGQGLMLAFAALALTHTVVNAAFGTVPGFEHNTVYALLLFAAVFAARSQPLAPFVSALKVGLLCFLAAGLLAAVVLPDIAVQRNYLGSWIPGLKVRLWGLGSNANSIGPLALLYFVLEWLQPTPQRWRRWSAVAVAGAVLLLAQSKTAWVAGFALALVLLVHRYARAPRGGLRLGFVIVALLSVAALVGALWAVSDILLVRLGSGRIGSDVATLTGRLQIWQVAIDTWLANPWFGYGPDVWGPVHRFRIGMPSAFSAHNQFLDSLSRAGLFGFVALLAYLVLLSAAAWRAARVTRGVSLALLVFLLARCITETPLAPATLLSAEIVTHLLLFRLALAAPSRTGVAARDGARTPPLRAA